MHNLDDSSISAWSNWCLAQCFSSPPLSNTNKYFVILTLGLQTVQLHKQKWFKVLMRKRQHSLRPACQSERTAHSASWPAPGLCTEMPGWWSPQCLQTVCCRRGEGGGGKGELVRETETGREAKKDKGGRQRDQSIKHTVNYHGLVSPSPCPSSLSSCHVSRAGRGRHLLSSDSHHLGQCGLPPPDRPFENTNPLSQFACHSLLTFDSDKWLG